MINTALFGIDLILIYIGWTYFLKPSILDHFRDQLFDLRDDVRQWYIDNNIPLSDSTYINLRDLLNSHLRFTETKSLVKVAMFFSKLKRNPKLDEWLNQQVEAKFSTRNTKIRNFVNESRSKAVNILVLYMIYSSPTMMLICFFIGIKSMLSDIKKFCKNAFKSDLIAGVISKKQGKSLEGYSASQFGSNYHHAF
jgi:hypothetical protein